MVFNSLGWLNSNIKVYTTKEGICLLIFKHWISSRDNSYELIARLIVDITIDPLKISVYSCIDEAIFIHCRSNPFGTLFRVHCRVSNYKHTRTKLTSVAIKLVNMRRTPCKSEVRSKAPVLRRAVVKT